MGKTINLAEKYSDKVQERFYMDSITQSSFSKDLDMEFTGVKTVKVTEVDVAPMNDYNRSGLSRYGTPQELTDVVQEFVMTQDKSFTFTIDKGNDKEQLGIKNAGKALRRQMREVVTPMIDRYRFLQWASHAGLRKGISAPTKSTIAELIMDGTAAMDDKFVPQDGRTIYIRNDLYKILKLCDEYIKIDSLGEKALVKGKVGEFDNMTVKKVPTSLMPAGVYFMIIYKGAAISPMKLNEYKIHSDPPGVSGNLVEGRVIYDAFVKATKCNGIYVACEAAKAVAAPTISISGGTVTLASTTSGATIKYTLDGSDPRFSDTALTYNSGSKPTAQTGDVVKAAAFLTGTYGSDLAESVA